MTLIYDDRFNLEHEDPKDFVDFEKQEIESKNQIKRKPFDSKKRYGYLIDGGGWKDHEGNIELDGE